MTGVLTDDELATFHERGYIVIRSAFDHTELAKAAQVSENVYLFLYLPLPLFFFSFLPFHMLLQTSSL